MKFFRFGKTLSKTRENKNKLKNNRIFPWFVCDDNSKTLTIPFWIQLSFIYEPHPARELAPDSRKFSMENPKKKQWRMNGKSTQNFISERRLMAGRTGDRFRRNFSALFSFRHCRMCDVVNAVAWVSDVHIHQCHQITRFSRNAFTRSCPSLCVCVCVWTGECERVWA